MHSLSEKVSIRIDCHRSIDVSSCPHPWVTTRPTPRRPTSSRSHPYIAPSETYARARATARGRRPRHPRRDDVVATAELRARDGVCDDDVDDVDGDGDVARDVCVVETDARNRETRDDDDDDDGRGPREEGFHAAARDDDDAT